MSDSNERAKYEPVAAAAAKWWADTMRGGDRGSGANAGPEFALLSALVRKVPEPSRVAAFEAELRHRIVAILCQGGTRTQCGSDGTKKIYKEERSPESPLLTLSCDYEPTSPALLESLDAAGIIPNHALPQKTVMWIRAEYAVLKAGYGAKSQVLFGQTPSWAVR